MTTTPTYSHYGGFAEGDHVTRDGTDVHLVKDMAEDGFSAAFVCVVEPASGWTTIGEEERNICRRYLRVRRNETTRDWEPDPGDARWRFIEPTAMMKLFCKRLMQELVDRTAQQMTEIVKSWLDQSRKPKSRPHYRRNFKRRALRK